MTASVKTVSTDSMQMDYVKFGSGRKSFVILPGLSIHSVTRYADSIAEAYKDFTADYTVYLFDRAKDIREGYSIRDMAADTAAAMNELRIADADVFGASQGGMMAQYLAIDHPRLIHKMILGSTLAKPNAVFNKAVAEWARLAEERNEPGLLESFAVHVYSRETLRLHKDELMALNLNISEDEFKRFLVLTDACKTFNCFDELSSVQCPVFVIGAEGDRVVTAEGSKQIADALGCGLYLYGANYGHGVYDEAPDYKQRCLNFLEND